MSGHPVPCVKVVAKGMRFTAEDACIEPDLLSGKVVTCSSPQLWVSVCKQ